VVGPRSIGSNSPGHGMASDANTSRREAMFAALAVPNFRRYVSGQALSLIGTWVETVAQALLVLQLTHSGVLLGLAPIFAWGVWSAAVCWVELVDGRETLCGRGFCVRARGRVAIPVGAISVTGI